MPEHMAIRYKLVAGNKVVINNYSGGAGTNNSVLSVMEIGAIMITKLDAIKLLCPTVDLTVEWTDSKQ